MKHLAGRVALVTGAGSGIGRETALAVAREGADVVLADINERALADVQIQVAAHSNCLLARTVDVSSREAMSAFAAEVHERVPCVDVLVNSAGVYLTGGFLDISLEDWDWVLSVNLWGMIHSCRWFVPPIVRRGTGGHIVNVASMYGFWPSPGVAGYLTSKFAVFGFSEALREDLRCHGIGVSTVCPGIINTGLVGSMRIRNVRNTECLRSHLQGFYRRRAYGPERVARAIVRGIKRNRKVVFAGPESRLVYYAERFLPSLSRLVARRAARRMFAPNLAGCSEGRVL